MKNTSLSLITLAIIALSCNPKIQESNTTSDKGGDTATAKLVSKGGKVAPSIDPHNTRHLFMDVHNLKPGGVTFEAVAGAHQKDLATQGKYGVNFIKYWVDEKAGKVYCLAEAADSASVYQTHKEAHGLVPDLVQHVSDGPEARAVGNRALYLDIHHLGAGSVTAAGVANAHHRDLLLQDKRRVNFINYWVDEKTGVVMCLSEAKDSTSIAETHKEAHGLLPQEVHSVKQGQ